MRTRNLLFLVACLIFSLNVKAQDDYLRVTDLSQIQNGSSIIFAARHDSLSTTSYYAMSNDAQGKPQGVLFTAMNSNDTLVLPKEITDNDTSYCWTVGASGEEFTFINPNGDMIGYGSSGTDFVKNGVNSTWTITPAVSGKGTSVPNHNAFVITNAGMTNRSIAFRKYSSDAVYEKFAPYANSTTNLEGDIYFFYLDIFVKKSEAIPVVSLPKFSPVSGNYTSEQNVTISCDTEGATIYYTLNGKNPTEDSDVYASPIKVSETTTIKAFATKDGMKNSGIATATFKIIETVDVSFYDNGKLLQTMTIANGDAVGELPVAVAPEGFAFSGWTETEITGAVNKTPDMITSSTVIKEDTDLYAVFSITSDNCVEAEVSSLSKSDDVIIAISKDGKYYAMSQEKGTSGQPMSKELKVSNGTIESAISDDVKWNVEYNKGDMVIYPSGNEDNWLYCTSGSNNNAVRIGTNADNNIFEMKSVEIDDVVYSNYLYNKATERFVGAYYDNEVAVDWRAYKLTASGAFPTNIKDQTYHFFKSEGKSFYCTNVDMPQSQTVATNTVWENVCIVNKVIIENGATLTINGAISCVDADNLVIKDGGQLLHNNGGVMATMEKEVQGYGSTNEGWYTISSPLVKNVELSEVKELIPSNNDYDLYRYDEPASCWENVKDNTNNFTTFESGRGYLYASKYDATISFVGEVSGESKSYDLTKTEGINLSGFHLIGNPYTHNIYKGSGAAIDDDNLVEGYYALSNSGAWEVNVPNEKPITPCQSILVKTIKSGEIMVNKTNQKPSQKYEDDEMLLVKVSNKDYEDKAYVSFGEGYGLEKVNHQNKDVPMIYFPIADVNYAIAVLDTEVKEVPLSFEAKIMGEYTISVETEAYDEIYLVDNMTGDVTNMLTDDYTFVATSNDAPNRFVVRLGEGNYIDEHAVKDNFAYVNNGKLMLSGISDNAQIDVYDVMGRRVLCDVVNGTNETYTIEMNGVQTGLYIVKVSDKEGIKMQKIIL